MAPEYHCAAVPDRYGPGYFAERAITGEPTTELWLDLARHGFIGINFPAEYGGGGAGMAELGTHHLHRQ